MYNEYFPSQGNQAMNNRHFNAEGNFYGAEFYGADGDQRMAAPIQNSLPFTIQFQNTSTSTNRTATIWDAANSIASGSSGNYGNSVDLVITVLDGQWSYAQLLQMIIATPVRIARVDIEGSTTSTVANNACTITEYVMPGGQKITNSYSPAINKFQQQNQSRTLDVPFTLNAMALFSQTVNASSTLIYRFYPNAVINPSRAAAGMQPTVLFGSPKTQGLEVIGNYNTPPSHSALMLGQ
jgi:hypothetical protein